MIKNDQSTEFTSALAESIENNTFVSLSLGNYKGSEEQLKNIYIKKILVKKQEKLSFTYRYKTRDIVKNYPPGEALALVGNYLKTGFRHSTLLTTGSDFLFEILNNGKIQLKKKPASSKEVPPTGHDHSKNRIISAVNKPYLTELKITDQDGNVFKNAQDKYRQINHYIEILSSLIKDIPAVDTLKVVDMGSGKGYLTFALYDYIQNVLNRETEVTGVEFREDMVNLCNQIAGKSGFKNLGFREGTIEQYDSGDINILIALHACDTATDDAILKGITGNADLIVVAPCCHKQIRREMEKHKTANDMAFLLKYGIFLERQAEMVTDGIRALIMEYFGYKTKVFEFISDVHTPKNVMIVGEKIKKGKTDQENILGKIKEAKSYFGIDYHHLEKIAGL
jgi:SAM-dependent methyltransferase